MTCQRMTLWEANFVLFGTRLCLTINSKGSLSTIIKKKESMLVFIHLYIYAPYPIIRNIDNGSIRCHSHQLWSLQSQSIFVHLNQHKKHYQYNNLQSSFFQKKCIIIPGNSVNSLRFGTLTSFCIADAVFLQNHTSSSLLLLWKQNIVVYVLFVRQTIAIATSNCFSLLSMCQFEMLQLVSMSLQLSFQSLHCSHLNYFDKLDIISTLSITISYNYLNIIVFVQYWIDFLFQWFSNNIHILLEMRNSQQTYKNIQIFVLIYIISSDSFQF
jgi:hypothetical protein